MMWMHRSKDQLARQLPLQCGANDLAWKCIGIGEILIPPKKPQPQARRKQDTKMQSLCSITDYIASYMTVESNTNL